MAFLVDAQDSAAGTPGPAPHPLAPLTAAEIEALAATVPDNGLTFMMTASDIQRVPLR